MAVNKEAIKKSANSGGYKNIAEDRVYEQGEDARVGFALVVAYFAFNGLGAVLFGLGYIGAEPSLELVGGSIVGAIHLGLLANYLLS